MGDKAKYYMMAIAVSTLLITFLHHSVFWGQSPRILLEELYYIPLLMGVLAFGLRGALWTYLFVSTFYLPYFWGDWTRTFLDLLDRLLHLLFSGIFVFFAGFLIDRESKLQKQSERERYLAGIGQMAATIAHDLKNPLITILGFARRLQAGKTQFDLAIRTILHAAENMQRVVNGTLDFVKPIDPERKEQDLVTVLRQACDSCRIKAEERGVTLNLEHSQQPIFISVDAFQIQRAIVNLIDNSIEASCKGQTVTISTWREKHRLTVKLKDEGSGMDRETLENIFIPFYTKKRTGTGLGMAIVKKIIDGHQGKIHIKSRPRMGTEVTIELPCRLEPEEKVSQKEGMV